MNFEIAVAIPVYNRADYLKETLDSVLNQTYPPAEVVVVDDGSTDHTPAVLASYGKRIKSIRIENSGPGVARKTAAEATTCSWLAFCDSDDIWLPEHLQRRASLLAKHPEVNFSFSDLIPFGPAALPDRTYFSDAPENWWQRFGTPDADNCIVMGNNAYRSFLVYNPGSPVTTVMTRDLYDKIGGIDPRYSWMVSEDADMALKAALHGYVLCDLTVTAKQRRHAGNMSGAVLKNYLGACRIREDHIKLKVAPEEHHDAVDDAIRVMLQNAFLAAYYAEDEKALREIVGRLGFARLTTKNKLRFIRSLLRRAF
ncbi:glycosyltransferase family 2 protein [Methylocaldum sp. GT1TLB]|uniref:glycosyltransferase family 2 protein n=1 Tax=Methylocaldum sp. GT1TLB TaxID=3438965 RepID=UPI003DA18E9E